MLRSSLPVHPFDHSFKHITTQISNYEYKIKLDDKIYDFVAEDDYANLVTKRRAAIKDFMVDDGGLGYDSGGRFP